MQLPYVLEWCSQYRKKQIDTKKLQTEIDEFMDMHDKLIEQVTSKLK